MGHWRYRELAAHHHSSQCIESWGSHPGSWAPEFTLLTTALGNIIEARQCSGVGTGAMEIHRASWRELLTGLGSRRDERATGPELRNCVACAHVSGVAGVPIRGERASGGDTREAGRGPLKRQCGYCLEEVGCQPAHEGRKA